MSSAPHQAFAVGRITRDGQRTLVVSAGAQAPIPGPWELKAVVTGRKVAAPR